jgi:hypothetical protein
MNRRNFLGLMVGMIIALLSLPVFANDLPEAPKPMFSTAPAARVPTLDKEFIIEAVALATAWTADTISTHQWIQHCPTCYEVGGLFNGSRSTAKIMGAWALVDLGTGIVAYEWKKHVKNRYLHELWRVPMLVQTEGHTQSVIHNSTIQE